jgi:hypothetical protein
VSFQEVVHSEQICQTGVTTPQFFRIAPNEHPYECQIDPFASRGNGERSDTWVAGCAGGLSLRCFSKIVRRVVLGIIALPILLISALMDNPVTTLSG